MDLILAVNLQTSPFRVVLLETGGVKNMIRRMMEKTNFKCGMGGCKLWEGFGVSGT